MSIEFNPTTNMAKMVYAGKKLDNRPPIVQQAIEVVAGKYLKDVDQAEKRAVGCGCPNCYRDIVKTKEWYGTPII